MNGRHLSLPDPVHSRYNSSMPDRLEIAAKKLRTALDLHDFVVEMMRENLKRRHPDLDAAGIDALLVKWLRTRPGAEHGDSAGVPGTWPRRR